MAYINSIRIINKSSLLILICTSGAVPSVILIIKLMFHVSQHIFCHNKHLMFIFETIQLIFSVLKLSVLISNEFFLCFNVFVDVFDQQVHCFVLFDLDFFYQLLIPAIIIWTFYIYIMFFALIYQILNTFFAMFALFDGTRKWQIIWRFIIIEINKMTVSIVAEFVCCFPPYILLHSSLIEMHGLRSKIKNNV